MTSRIIRWFSIVLITWLINLVSIVGLTQIVLSFTPFESIPPSKLGNVTCDNYVEKMLIGCIVAPIVEELIFRYPINLTHRAIILYVPIGLIAISSFLFDHSMLSRYSMAVMAIYYIAAFGFKLVNIDSLQSPSYATQRRVVVISIVSSALFSWSHHLATDFSLKYSYLILLPHFVSGILLCFVRLKFGLSYTIATHILHNSILIMLALSIVLGNC